MTDPKALAERLEREAHAAMDTAIETRASAALATAAAHGVPRLKTNEDEAHSRAADMWQVAHDAIKSALLARDRVARWEQAQFTVRSLPTWDGGERRFLGFVGDMKVERDRLAAEIEEMEKGTK